MASMARCRRRRKVFSSVGSESGVPREGQMTSVTKLSRKGPSLRFHAFSEFGLKPAVSLLVRMVVTL